MKLPMTVTPVFHFHGQGAQAIELYKQAFGAEVAVLLRYADADPRDFDEPLTAAQKQCVYHAEIMIDGQRIMLSDHLDGDMPKDAPVSLCVTFDTAERVHAAYEALLDGAEIIHPMISTTYSTCFVALKDRYGIRWELMTETG